MKDVDRRRDDEDQENGTNGEDRKGSFIKSRPDMTSADQLSSPLVEMGSPVPAHDELDTAE